MSSENAVAFLSSSLKEEVASLQAELDLKIKDLAKLAQTETSLADVSAALAKAETTIIELNQVRTVDRLQNVSD